MALDLLSAVGEVGARVRVEGLLESGETYQVVKGEEIATGQPVCVKAIHYDAGRLDDADYIEARRRALRRERDFLEAAAGIDGLPRLVDYFETESLASGLEEEPVLVYRYVPGRSIYAVVKAKPTGGLEASRGREVLGRLVEVLAQVHELGWTMVDLDPRHVLVDGEGRVSLVGTGNAHRRGERPIPEVMNYAANPYVAPEVRAERSGKMLRPSADAYALGALMSFVLTGEEPRVVVENPLNYAAFDALSNLDPPGLALIVARCIQPMAKKRFSRFERLLPLVGEDSLPGPTTKGFGMLMLPAPFSGVENPEQNRALKSRLSAGPLISTPARVDDEKDQDGEMGVEPKAWSPPVGLVIVVPMVVLLLLGLLAAFGVL